MGLISKTQLHQCIFDHLIGPTLPFRQVIHPGGRSGQLSLALKRLKELARLGWVVFHLRHVGGYVGRVGRMG